MENFTILSNHTFWEFFGSSYLKHELHWTIALIVAYATIFILGCIGNITVILVISCNNHMKTVTNLFILNLAVADLFVVLFCVPVTLVANIYAPWVFDTVLCKTLPYVQGVSVCASVYSLVAISVDRCGVFYGPTGQHHGMSKSSAKFVIFIIWTVALIVTAPWLYVFETGYSTDDHDYGYPYCHENWPDAFYGNMYFVAIHLILCFVLPLLIITVLSLVIWRNMQKFQKAFAELQIPYWYNIPGITKLLCLISITFMITWTPLYVLMTKIKLFGATEMSVTEEGEKQGNLELILIPIAQWLGSFYSCVNPILYAFHSKRFQTCVKNYFRRIRRRMNDRYN